MDVTGNAYVVGGVSQNALKITPAGVITEIIAVDAAGNAYVTGVGSDNAFKMTLDEDDDGVRNEIDVCPNTPAGLPVACNGRPLRDCNVDCLFDSDDIQCIVDELLNQ